MHNSLKNTRGPAILLVVLAAVFLVAPHLYNNQSILFTMMVFMALAQGLNLLYGFTGYLPFGYVGFFGTGAYVTAGLVTFTGLPVLLCVIGGGLGAVIIGLILGPLLRLSGAYFSIANLAASQVIYFVVSNQALQPVTGGPYGVKIEQVFAPRESYITMLVILLFTTAIAAYFRRSKFGLGLRAMKEDPISAGLAGVNVVRERLIVWLASAGVAGLVGGAYAWNLSVFYPDAVFTLQISVFAIVFALFGGVGTVIGPLVGGALLYTFYSVIGVSAPQYFELLYGLLIVLLVLFLPNGLLSLLTRRHIDVL